MRIEQLSLAAVVLLAGIGAAAAQQPPSTAPKLPDGVELLRDLQYVPDGHPRHRLDLYLPEKAGGPLPVIVWIHGGAWMMGNKDHCPAAPFAAKGYAVASINYRLSQQAVFPAQIEDCQAAVRWLRANAKKYNLDPAHVGVWGASAGGHLAALLGTMESKIDSADRDHSARVQAVVDWFGPADFLHMGRQFESADSPVARLLGGPIGKNQEKARRASPVTYVGKDAPPFLIMHGDQDNVVPLRQSELLAEVLKKAGAKVTFRVIHGEGHGGPQFGTPENRKLVKEFFDQNLRP